MRGLVAALVGVELRGAEALMCGAGAVTPLAIGLIAELLDGATQAG